MSAFDSAERFDAPYRHWIMRDFFPARVLDAAQKADFPIGDLNGLSGKREYHNDTRHYVDQANMARLPVFAEIGETFQAPTTVREIERFFDTQLAGTFLRIEYAQDVAGFWLQPHTDLGVKKLTILIYLSDGPDHETLGTDIYGPDKAWAKRSPFAPNAAMAFVPGDATYHGFEKRPINGVRKSLILNYVTTEWRDREQLAFPEETVTTG